MAWGFSATSWRCKTDRCEQAGFRFQISRPKPYSEFVLTTCFSPVSILHGIFWDLFLVVAGGAMLLAKNDGFWGKSLK
jgi:hypothetical protein